MRRSAAATVLATGLLAAGCALLPPNDPVPADGEVPMPMVTDCEPPLVFEGDTTLQELGLGDIQGLGPEATRRGLIRITRDTVTHEQFAPPNVPVAVPEGQLLCVTWPDGGGMTMMLSEPFGIEARAPAADGGLPLAPILVGLAVVIVAAISWFAFRREAPPAA